MFQRVLLHRYPGDFHLCQAKTDRSVVCWGLDDEGQSTAPEGEFLQVAGSTHTCGIRNDGYPGSGTIACWGMVQWTTDVPDSSIPFVQIIWRITQYLKRWYGIFWGANADGQSTPPRQMKVDTWPYLQEVILPVVLRLISRKTVVLDSWNVGVKMMTVNSMFHPIEQVCWHSYVTGITYILTLNVGVFQSSGNRTKKAYRYLMVRQVVN